MNRILLSAVLAVTLFSSCTRNMMVAPQVKKVALVQYSHDHWMYVMGPGQAHEYNQLMDRVLQIQLDGIHTVLGKYWQVRRAAEFISLDDYRFSAGARPSGSVHVPLIGDTPMPMLTEFDRIGSLDAETASKLCASLQVDALVLVSSRWGIRSIAYGAMLYPEVKVWVSFYDRTGARVFYDKKYEKGNRLEGAFVARIDENALVEWMRSTNRTIDEIIRRYKTK